MVSVAGVAPILVHIARTAETFQVSGVGPYPRASTLEYFRGLGNQIPPGLPRTVVPAAPAAWCMALERWGTMSFAEVATAATEHAGRGFPLSSFSAYQMTANADKYRRWATSAALYLNNGRPFRMGERLVQAELAETLARMARAEAKAGGSRAAGVRAARDEFYRGETAKRIAEFHRAEKGPLTLDDLAAFEVEIERALVGTWGPWQVGVCGFWCQGPVLLQMLNLLEGTDLAALGREYDVHHVPARRPFREPALELCAERFHAHSAVACRAFARHAERLTAPLVRQADGKLAPVTWEEVLPLLAERFTQLKLAHGADAIAGLITARCTNEDLYVLGRLAFEQLKLERAYLAGLDEGWHDDILVSADKNPNTAGAIAIGAGKLRSLVDLAADVRSGAIAALGVTLLKFVAVYSVFDAVNLVTSFALRGAGDTRFVTVAALGLAWPVMVLPTWAAWRFGWGLAWAWGFASVYVAILALTFWFLGRLERSRLGRSWVAIRRTLSIGTSTRWSR